MSPTNSVLTHSDMARYVEALAVHIKDGHSGMNYILLAKSSVVCQLTDCLLINLVVIR